MCESHKIASLLLTFLCLEISVVCSAPLLQLQQPYPRIAMPQSQQTLQQQLMELQAMQQFNLMPQYGLSQLQPIIMLLPDQPMNMDFNMIPNINDRIEHESKLDKDKHNQNDMGNGDEDSDVINAEPMPILEEQKAFLLIPNGRLSIGNVISAIPFLPIEINVPDTISWAYNGISSGISSIISIIGSRLPFQRPQDEALMKNINLKSVINELQMKNRNNIRPLVVIPLADLNRPISTPFVL